MRKVLVLLAIVIMASIAYKPAKQAFARFQAGVKSKGGVLSCQFNGKEYKAGEQRHANDACNVCTCGKDGWSCTKIFCPAGSDALGTLSGVLGNPEAKVPALRVCAVNLKDDQEYCQQTLADDLTYAIPVPAGDYWVYAKKLSDEDDRRAFYSEFERCGEKKDCRDHSPISVTVESGKIAKADPKDWTADGQIDDLDVTPAKFDYGIHNYYPQSNFIVKTRKIMKVKVMYKPWPPENATSTALAGDAMLTGTDHDTQTWLLPVRDGFEATSVYAIGTMQNGDTLRSREMKFVRPIKTASDTSNVQ